MTGWRSGGVWRFLAFSAAPFLVVLAVVLIRNDDAASRSLGVALAVAAVLCVVAPLVIRRPP